MPGRWAWALLAAGVAHAAALAWPLPGPVAGQPLPWLQWLALCVLAAGVRRAPSRAAAFWRGWGFATAWLAATFWWLFISMHVYGGLAAPLAALAVLALAAFLGLYTAGMAALLWRWRRSGPWRYALVFAAGWTLAEWARGTWLTGFPWGAAGYALVDAYAAWAPWVGVYGMGALSAGLAAGLAAWGLERLGREAKSPQGRPGGAAWGARIAAGVAVLALGPVLWWPSGGVWLADRLPAWTVPAGDMPVALLQGNIPQDEKFAPGVGVPLALDWYETQVAEALRLLDARGGGLVVAPETAIPLLPQDMDPAWWARWRARIADSRSAVLLGLPLGSWAEGYTNSVAGWAASREMYRYDKHHLVPFGEFVPPLFRWFVAMMDIPLGDFRRGPLGQPPFEWGGQRIAPNVCYEDLFGEELAVAFHGASGAPTVLVNVSNIAWFGDTVAIDQHRHISRLRALELQRPMLRATNTGATVVIDHLGRVQAELPRLTRGRLEATVQGRQGLTPYARWAGRWGQWPLVGLALLVLVGARRPR